MNEYQGQLVTLRKNLFLPYGILFQAIIVALVM
jgi:hypothetical protein